MEPTRPHKSLSNTANTHPMKPDTTIPPKPFLNGSYNRPRLHKKKEKEKKEEKIQQYRKAMSKLSVKAQNRCLKCGEAVVTDHKGGRVVCTSCGVVKVDRFIDTSSEYRSVAFIHFERVNEPMESLICHYAHVRCSVFDIFI